MADEVGDIERREPPDVGLVQTQEPAAGGRSSSTTLKTSPSTPLRSPASAIASAQLSTYVSGMALPPPMCRKIPNVPIPTRPVIPALPGPYTDPGLTMT